MSIEGTERLREPHERSCGIEGVNTSFVERGVCPICDGVSFNVLREAQYPPNLSRESLLSVYRSSSDHALMDQLVSCTGCGLVYLNPRVAKEIALASYSSAVDPRFVLQNEARIRTFTRTLKTFTRKYNIKPTKDTRILDVGCAGGAFVKAATDAGFSAVGIEPSSWMCEFGRTEYGIDIRPGILEDFTFPEHSFDIITLWDVLEHVYTPVEVLRECHRILKPGGLLVVNYPDYASAARKVLGWKWPFFLSCHLFYFTPSSITRLLKRCDLDVVEVKTFFQTLEFGYVLERASPYFTVCGWLSRVVTSLGLGALPMTYNMGQSMVVAKKHA